MNGINIEIFAFCRGADITRGNYTIHQVIDGFMADGLPITVPVFQMILRMRSTRDCRGEVRVRFGVAGAEEVITEQSFRIDLQRGECHNLLTTMPSFAVEESSARFEAEIWLENEKLSSLPFFVDEKQSHQRSENVNPRPKLSLN